jgi:glycolate oxidase
MAEAVRKIEEIAQRYNLRIGTFGHAGDGNLHPTIVVDKDIPEEVRKAELALREIFQIAIDLGGTITGEHGVGSAKLPFLEPLLGPVNMQLQRNIKKVFDPKGILNPGRLGS